MSEPIHLAFVWHQHQPYYKDTLTGHLEMPWVRLHGIKDYYGMAALIEPFKGVRATINFVPSLLAQLDDYLNGAEDIWQSVAKIPARSLNEEQRKFVLENFFMASVNTMIRPFPRYFELFSKRGGDAVSEKTLSRFSDADFLDLQVLANLAWFHPISLSNDPFLSMLVEKGRDFSETDKNKLLEKQLEILAQIVPLHKKLQDEGRIELSTTPFYHPIIPLLVDEKSVLEAIPNAPLPRRTNSMAGDALTQIKTAYEYHEHKFGKAPKGMWPSEGSISQEAAELFCSAGVQWIATDQINLSRSRSHIPVAERHHFRPYRVKGITGNLCIIFRDHVLSDLLSFQYQYYREEDAVNDFISRIREVGKSIKERPACVFVIMDGENAWEHYRQSARPFFELLYQRLCDCNDIKMTTVSDLIEKHPPSASIDRLASGSWINGDFAIWASHSEDVRAWEYLDRVREDLRGFAKSKSPLYPQEQLRAAWEEIFIAQGSDYFWWFGDDHSSAQDKEFDALFRMHLKNVYRHLGEPYPDFLDTPIKKVSYRQLFKQPSALLNIKIDGRVSSFLEWHFAGRYDAGADYGSMARVAKGRLLDVFFGFDESNLFVRIDLGAFNPDVQSSIIVDIRKPLSTRFHFAVKKGVAPMLIDGEPDKRVGLAGLEKVFEAKVPLETIGAKVGDDIEFQVQIEDEGKMTEVLPRGGVFSAKVPSHDFDYRNWGL